MLKTTVPEPLQTTDTLHAWRAFLAGAAHFGADLPTMLVGRAVEVTPAGILAAIGEVSREREATIEAGEMGVASFTIDMGPLVFAIRFGSGRSGIELRLVPSGAVVTSGVYYRPEEIGEFDSAWNSAEMRHAAALASP